MSLREYVLECYPAAAGNARLVEVLIKLQAFNPHLPADVDPPDLEVLDWRQAQKVRQQGRTLARMLLSQGLPIRPYWEQQLKENA